MLNGHVALDYGFSDEQAIVGLSQELTVLPPRLLEGSKVKRGNDD